MISFPIYCPPGFTKTDIVYLSRLFTIRCLEFKAHDWNYRLSFPEQNIWTKCFIVRTNLHFFSFQSYFCFLCVQKRFEGRKTWFSSWKITGGSKPIISSRSTSSTVCRRTPCTCSRTPYDGWQYAPGNASPRNARHAHAPETPHATGYGSWPISTYALRTTPRASRKTRVASSAATTTGMIFLPIFSSLRVCFVNHN